MSEYEGFSRINDRRSSAEPDYTTTPTAEEELPGVSETLVVEESSSSSFRYKLEERLSEADRARLLEEERARQERMKIELRPVIKQLKANLVRTYAKETAEFLVSGGAKPDVELQPRSARWERVQFEGQGLWLITGERVPNPAGTTFEGGWGGGSSTPLTDEIYGIGLAVNGTLWRYSSMDSMDTLLREGTSTRLAIEESAHDIDVGGFVMPDECKEGYSEEDARQSGEVKYWGKLLGDVVIRVLGQPS